MITGFAVAQCSRSTKKRRPLSQFEVARVILLSKGATVVPRAVVLAINGRMKTCEIISIMEMLSDKGAGSLNYVNRKVHFLKRKAEEITDILEKFSIPIEDYVQRYYGHNTVA